MGYSQESKAYRLYDPEAKKIVVSCHLMPVSKAELQNEEYFEEKTPPTLQHALAPQGKPLPKWARQLFDEKNLIPYLVESSADGLR